MITTLLCLGAIGSGVFAMECSFQAGKKNDGAESVLSLLGLLASFAFVAGATWINK